MWTQCIWLALDLSSAQGGSGQAQGKPSAQVTMAQAPSQSTATSTGYLEIPNKISIFFKKVSMPLNLYILDNSSQNY